MPVPAAHPPKNSAGLKAFFTTPQLSTLDKIGNSLALGTSPIVRRAGRRGAGRGSEAGLRAGLGLQGMSSGGAGVAGE